MIPSTGSGPAGLGPVPFWFWNARLDEKEIRRQVRLMRQGGLKAFLIHARWGLKTPYLSPLWWRQVGAAVDEAKKLGMKIWFYDEYNYPSGIGGFKVSGEARFRERFLAAASARGKKIELKAPKGEPVSAYARSDSGELRELKWGSTLRFESPDAKPWTVTAFAMQVESFKGSGKYSINYLAPEPTQRFIQITHEAYKKRFARDFGKTIPGFFLDEPRFNNALPYDERLPKWFKARYGYDPIPKLGLLIGEGKGAAKFRQDWWGLISALYCKHFFEPIGKWCKKNGLELTGHLMAEETLAGSTRYSGEGLAPYRHFSIPGCDMLGLGIGGIAPKIASSMASHQGAAFTSCEVFAGCGWDFGFDEMRAMTLWLYSQGLNMIVPHAFFYAAKTKRQRSDWPPSMFFQWKHWPRYPSYAREVERLTEGLSGGRAACDIALFHPGRDFHARYVADPAFRTGYFAKGPRINNKEAMRMEEQVQRLAQGLPQQHLDFEFISQATLGNIKRYRLLIIPHGAEAPKLRGFRGKVLRLGPSATPPYAKIRALLGKPDIILSGAPGLKGQGLELDTRIHDPYLRYNLRSLLKSGKGGVWARHYRKGGKDAYFFANLTREPKSFKAKLRDRGEFKVELKPLDWKLLKP